MGCNPDGSWKAHRVTISRSFWMAKFPVTYAQAKEITGRVCMEKNPSGLPPFPWNALGGDKTPAGMSPRQALELVAVMNKKYSRHLPKGYVFRFPTEAEWEYVFKGGREKYWNGDMLRKRSLSAAERQAMTEKANLKVKDFDKYPWVFPCVAVGTKEASEWGFYDLMGNGWAYLLDTVEGAPSKGRLDVEAEHLADFYKDGDVDPVLHYDGQGKQIVMRGSGWGRGAKFKGKECKKILLSDGNGEIFHHDVHVRLVIGPDLLKERGIKLPDLEK